MKTPFSNFPKFYQHSLIIGGISVALVLVQPFLWRLVEERATELNEKQSSDQQIEEVRRRSQQIAADIKAQTADVAEINSAAPPPRQLSAVIEEFEQQADNQQVTITIADIDQSTTSQGDENENSQALLTTIINLQATGSVNRLLGYLEQVEHMTYLTLVNEVELNPANPSQAVNSSPITELNQLVYTMSLQVTLFLADI